MMPQQILLLNSCENVSVFSGIIVLNEGVVFASEQSEYQAQSTYQRLADALSFVIAQHAIQQFSQQALNMSLIT